MKAIATIRRSRPNLASKIASQAGFLTPDNVRELAAAEPHVMVLIRCGNGRFLCPAQDAMHFAEIIAEHSTLKAAATGQDEVYCGDYVRDFSLPA